MTIEEYKKLNINDIVVCINNIYDFTVGEKYNIYALYFYTESLYLISNNFIITDVNIKNFESLNKYILNNRKDKLENILK